MPGNFHEVPASIIATWPKPNYVDPVRRTWLPALACTLLAVSTVLISGRFFLRIRKQAGAFGYDDALIAIGWLVSIGFSAVACNNSLNYGIDRHTWDVRLDQYTGAALGGWIAQVLFLVSTCATKCSVLLFYRRMADGTFSKKWRYGIWVALGFLGGYFISTLIVYCLICQPLSSYWLSYRLDYHEPYTCIDGNVLSPFVGVLSVITDIYSVVLPCIMLQNYDLDVSRRQKIGLNVVFGLGLLVAGAGIARTYYLYEINHTYDTSWAGFDLFAWALVECHLAVICACAPSCRAFIRRYLSEPFSRSFNSNSSRRVQDTRESYNQLDFGRKSESPQAPVEMRHMVDNSTLDRQISEEHSDYPRWQKQGSLDLEKIGRDRV